MPNLDPHIAKAVKMAAEVAKRMTGEAPGPYFQAALQAYAECLAHPGSEVKVTCLTRQGYDEAWAAIWDRAVVHDNVDVMKTSRANFDNDLAFNIELKNGSAVKLVLIENGVPVEY